MPSRTIPLREDLERIRQVYGTTGPEAANSEVDNLISELWSKHRVDLDLAEHIGRQVMHAVIAGCTEFTFIVDSDNRVVDYDAVVGEYEFALQLMGGNTGSPRVMHVRRHSG